MKHCVSLLLVCLLVGCGEKTPEKQSDSKINSITVEGSNGFVLKVDQLPQVIYLPSNFTDFDALPTHNSAVGFSVIKDGRFVKAEGGYYNIGGTPTKAKGKSSDRSVCGIEEESYYLAHLDIKSEGTCAFTISFLDMAAQVETKFVAVPILSGDKGRLEETKTTLIERFGFPTSKKTVTIDDVDTYRLTDGYYHTTTGQMEHWRYDAYPGLVIAIFMDNVLGIASE